MNSNLAKQVRKSSVGDNANHDIGDPTQPPWEKAAGDRDLRAVIGIEEVTLKSRKAKRMQ